MGAQVNNLPHQQTRSTVVNDMEIDNSKNINSGTAQLVQLQSKDHEEILNVIDQLRSEGISKYVSLPQLIVCGDQSSGKSSVLEAITGLGFPTKDNVCTRFATELILRRAPNSGVTASIQPDPERAQSQREHIRAFRSPTVALSQFAEIVSSAENFIGVGQDGHLFSKDVLRVEVSGPTQPHLTLVDLPGLYHASDEFQDEEGVQFVESLVLSYIRNKRSVILAVISAKSDIALQKVTAFTRKVDPQGARTMGIITKPDTLSETSDMERSFLNLARNVRVPFRLGWHVLKNRKYEERHFSLEQRREAESDFLASGVWSTLPRSQVGIDALRPRLSSILKDHIVSQVPGLILETQQAFEDTTTHLHKLGEARKTIVDQRRYLTHRSERFTALIGYAINGVYFDPFFGDAMEEVGYLKRIRARVQNCLADFSLVLTHRGEQRKIVDNLEAAEQGGAQISRAEFVEEVRQRQRRSRGQELLGTFNPLIIGDLFYLQSKPWEAITIECIDDLMENVLKTVMLILEDTVDEKSSRGLLELVITPSLEKIEKSLRSKTTELLRPQQLGHPITYNHSFTAAVQDARERHLRDSITEKLKDFFGPSYRGNSFAQSSYSFRMDDLIGAIVSQTENDMEYFACSEAVDYMQAYYKVCGLCFILATAFGIVLFKTQFDKGGQEKIRGRF